MKLTHCIALIAIVLSSACGKYGPPLPPESLSPRPVQELTARAETDGVRFEWKAPSEDIRGKELKTMTGYKILRKDFTGEKDLIASKYEYELVGEVEDTHVIERDRIREELRSKNIPSHRAKVDDALKQFEFLDTAVEPGRTYLYRIVPVNQGSVEGEFDKFVKVSFKGDSSDVTLIDRRQEELL